MVFARILRTTFFILSGLVVSLYLLIWLLSPYIVKSQAEAPLAELGFRLDEQSSIRFNPFTFTLHIQDFKLHADSLDQPGITIARAQLNLDTYGVFRKALVVERFSIEDSQLRISVADQGLAVAGYLLPKSGSSEQPEESPDQTESPINDWRLEVQEFSIKQFATHLNNHSQEHTLNLEGLTVFNLGVSLADQVGGLNLNAKLNEATLEGLLQFKLQQNEGTARIELALDNFDPAQFNYLLPPELEKVTGKLSLQTEQSVTLTQKSIDIDIERLKVSVTEFQALTQGLDNQFDHLSLDIQDAKVTTLEGALKTAELAPSISLENTHVFKAGSEDKVLSLNKLDTSGLEIKLSDEGTQLDLEELSLKVIELSNAQALPALFSGAGLSIRNVSTQLSETSAAGTTIGEIELLPFQSHVNVSSDGALANLVLPANSSDEKKTNETEIEPNPEPADTVFADTAVADTGVADTSSLDAAAPQTEDASQQSSNENSPAHRLVLERFHLGGTSEISVNDQSVTPAFSDLIHLNELELGKVDSMDPALPTTYVADFKTGKYSGARITGDIKVFSQKVNMNLDAKMHEFALPKVSPYVRGAAGFDLLAGQFDLDTRMSILEDEIDGESLLKLRGIELESAKDVKQGELSDHSFIPLNLALGSLKDSDGNIELDIGLSGNVHDPSFGLDGFIYLITQKAVLAAAESYAINTFVPYANIVSLAKVAGSYALKVRIDDLPYQAKQLEPSEEQQAFMGNLVALFEEKPDLQIKVCPIATPEDYQDDADIADPATIKALKALADQRGEHFKAVLNEGFGVASSRILLCQARIDANEGALPRLEFSI